MARTGSMVLAIAAALAAVPGLAQAPDQSLDIRPGPDARPSPDARVVELLARAKQVYTVPDPRDRCRRTANSDEIVVCVDRGEDLRVPSTAESDPTSREALDDGVPRAPQFDRGSCRGQGGCMVGGWAPPPVYVVDVSALPQAPEGSDADRIAKGELAAP